MRKKTILTVCHDAGGAEVVSAYVKKNISRCNFICLAEGPAVKIFKRKGIKISCFHNDFADKLLETGQIDLVLTGTSWGSMAELEYINQAKKNKIKTAAYLDHWANYRERFGYPRKDWKKNLPDEIWVGDKYAREMAKKTYTASQKIKSVSNLYFIEIKKEYNEAKKRTKFSSGNILFMSEPICSPANCFGDESEYDFNEFEILKKLLEYFWKRKEKRKIIICFHPSEDKNKFDSIIAPFSGKLKIEKQKGNNILEEMVQAEILIGIMGMILAIAAVCGKKAVSYIPVKKVECPLPFNNIIKINNINQLDQIL